MAKKSTVTKTVETLTHEADKRKNIPTAEYQAVEKKELEQVLRVAYERRNRDLDSQLVWRGKAKTRHPPGENVTKFATHCAAKACVIRRVAASIC